MPLIVSGTDSITLPVGTTAQRNATPVTGMYRLNSTTGTTEVYNGTNWVTESPVAGTAVASTSGTSISFTGIPAGVKRITVMFNGVSTSGTSHMLVQIGSGSTTSTGYVSTGFASSNNVSPAVTSATAGFLLYNDNAGDIRSGTLTISNITGNTWVENHTMSSVAARAIAFMGGGTLALSGVLDRVVITTANGTDTFDAGSINILYE